MPPPVPKKKPSAGLGCLALFALPFAGVGTFMACLLLASLWSFAAMQGWQEVPARIRSVELEAHRGDKSTTYETTARYEYRFAGTTYVGRRVGLHGGSDNLGDWQRRVYGELLPYRGSARPFRAYVNPADPRQAILYRDLRWGRLGMYALFALLFGGAGYGMIVAGFIGLRRWRREEELKARHPGEPWRHREDWAAGEVRSAARPTMIFSLVFTAFWNLISLPLLFVLPGEVLEKGNRLALIGLIFPAIGAVLLVWAARSIIRVRKFGRSTLVLETLPGVVGGPLAGVIHTATMLRPEKGFRLTLDGVNRRTRRTGRNRRTQEHILHQESATVPLERTGQGLTGTTVPVRFAIPFEAPPTSDEDPDNRILWRVSVAAEVPGVDYGTRFEVPVFRSAASSPDYRPAPDETAAAVPDEALSSCGGLSVRQEGGVLTIALAAARNKGAAFGATAFLAIWSGFIALMLELGFPLYFTAFFGLFDLLILAGVIDLWCGAVRIEVRYGELRRRGGLFALGRRRIWTADEIDRLEPAAGAQAGRKLFYNLKLVPRLGRPRSIASRLDSRAQAEALARRIDAVLRGRAE